MRPESTAARAASVGAAVVLLGVIRLALIVLPFRHVVRVSEALVRLPAWLPRVDAPRIGQRVARRARHLPGASCLTQALATRVLLAWHGQPSELRFGVRRGADGLQAHAWVVHEDMVVVGGSDVAAYAALRRAEGRHAR